MQFLLLLLKQYRWSVTLAVVAAVASGAANTGLLAMLNRSINGMNDGGEALAWLFFGLCVVVPLCRIGSEVLLIRLGQNTVFRLRMDLSTRILGVALNRLETIGTPKLLSTLTADIPRITAVVTLIPLLCFNFAIVISCFSYLYILSSTAFLAMLGLMVAGILLYQIPVFKANRLFQEVRGLNDDLYRHFRGLTEGLKELKLHRRRREAFLFDSMQSTATDYKAKDTTASTIYTVASSWGQFMLFYILGLLVFVMPIITEVSRATVSGYALAFLYMMTPLQVIMNALPTLSRAGVSLERIDNLGLELEHDVEILHEGKVPKQWSRLEFSGVTHVYRLEDDDRNFTLGPIDLVLEPGELVFIVGGNGSGKTTFAKTLVGLYLPDAGEIHLDDTKIDDSTRDGYRELFTAVFSDFYLFEVLLGLDTPELDAAARKRLEQLQLDKLVDVEGGVLSSTKLSQGQRKRLALLVAYLEDRPIYLFDEWAADQDPVFKRFFYHEILPELKERGKTVLVISHDDAYYDVADRLIKLDYGRITSDERLETKASRRVVA